MLVAVVPALVPALLGRSAHPVDQPGLVLSGALAGPWTLAHELGHVLGLADVADAASLMFAASDPEPGGDPPSLSDDEIATIGASPLAQA